MIMQRQSLAVGSASESVHRLVWWTSQLATETGCFPQLGAMKGFFGLFRPFFALLPFVPELSASFRSWGALDDEEFFVIEGWGVALTPGVVLPGVRPPVVH